MYWVMAFPVIVLFVSFGIERILAVTGFVGVSVVQVFLRCLGNGVSWVSRV